MRDQVSNALDKLDRAILAELQADGRQSSAEIAGKVAASPATCHRRVTRLLDSPHITGVHAHINPDSVARSALVIVGVVLDRSTPASFADFERAIRDVPFVLDCHLVAGDFDFFLKLRVRDMADFNRLHGERLIALPGVRQTRTFFVMKEVVDGAPLSF